jgi:Ca2+-binding RTX toxin-like protein
VAAGFVINGIDHNSNTARFAKHYERFTCINFSVRICLISTNTLIGNGGTDVFYAGKGDDKIIINADNLNKLGSNALSSHLLARIDGGGGFDTLCLTGKGLSLDLTAINNSRIQGIEVINLTDSADNDLKSNQYHSFTIKSSKPSPLTSPAEETERPLLSPVFSPLITKPPVPMPDTEEISLLSR